MQNKETSAELTAHDVQEVSFAHNAIDDAMMSEVRDEQQTTSGAHKSATTMEFDQAQHVMDDNDDVEVHPKEQEKQIAEQQQQTQQQQIAEQQQTQQQIAEKQRAEQQQTKPPQQQQTKQQIVEQQQFISNPKVAHFCYDFAQPIEQVYQTYRDEFGFFNEKNFTRRGQPNFVKTVQWSPDGLCLLSNSDDNCVRLFDLFVALLSCHLFIR